MAEAKSSSTGSPSASTVTAVTPVQETQHMYSARVIIAVNRTARKNDKCHTKYPMLPESALKVAGELHAFFKSKNMYVYYKENVDKTAIGELVSEVIKQSCGNHEIILFYYIGHGEKGELLPHCTCKNCRLPDIEYDRESDGQPQNIVELIKMFYNGHSKHLRKIPMLFFFDCCQGKDYNEGYDVSMGGLPPDVQIREMISYVNQIPDAGSILIAHSTLPMLKAYCHSTRGPHWTRILLENLRIDQSISDALHATQREVSKIDCSIKDPSGKVIMYRKQPPMFYSTLSCKTINFYNMGAPHHKADSNIDVSSTMELDSGYPEESYSERVDGDDISGSEQSQIPAPQAKPRKSSSMQASESDVSDSVRIQELKKDIEAKTEEISRLEIKIKQLNDEAEQKDAQYTNDTKKKEEEFKIKLADKEKKNNALKTQLECTKETLHRTKEAAKVTKHRASENEEMLKEKIEQVKKKNEEEIKKLKEENDNAILRLQLKHAEEKTKLKDEIRSLKIEQERKKTEVAEEQRNIAILRAKLLELERDAARKEADKAKKERDEIKREAGKPKMKRDGSKGEANKEMDKVHVQVLLSSSTPTASIDSGRVSSSKNPQNGKNILNSDTGAAGPDVIHL